MTRDGEFLRSQPWRNTFGVPGPYGECDAPQDRFNSGSFGPRLVQFPGEDGHLARDDFGNGSQPPGHAFSVGRRPPQLTTPYGQWHGGIYPMDRPASFFGAFPGPMIPGPWHIQPAFPMSPYAWDPARAEGGPLDIR